MSVVSTAEEAGLLAQERLLFRREIRLEEAPKDSTDGVVVGFSLKLRQRTSKPTQST